MKAVVHDRYGFDALELREIETPTPADNEVLVRVRAASVNPADWYTAHGPLVARAGNGFRRPKNIRLGTDFAGTVEAIGANVTRFRPGDDVFGGRTGALADYVTVPEDRAIAKKPENVTFEEAGGVGIAGITALQGLRDIGHLQAGQKVLINGASGGVGTFAVQIAKALEAEVTAVCSTRNVDIARSLGADRVVDYTREDFIQTDERYDQFFDVAGSRSWSKCRRVMKPDATLVVVGMGGVHRRMLGPLMHLARLIVAGRLRGSQKSAFFVAKLTNENMNTMRELLERGKVRTVVDKTFPLENAADAFRYLGEGHAQGKIVVTV
jgi:NADPH:quinone reductase-like Zn-dependent oxidoreductase